MHVFESYWFNCFFASECFDVALMSELCYVFLAKCEERCICPTKKISEIGGVFFEEIAFVLKISLGPWLMWNHVNVDITKQLKNHKIILDYAHHIWEPTNMLVGIPTFYLPIMSNPCWGPRLYLSIYLPIMSKTQPPAGDLDFIYLSIFQ